MLADQSERALKDLQARFKAKDSDFYALEQHVRLLEEQIDCQKRASQADRDEVKKLRATVVALDREKDELQAAVDEKAEFEVKTQEAFTTRVSLTLCEVKLEL